MSTQLYLELTTGLGEIKNLSVGPGVWDKFMAYANEGQIS